MKKYIVNATGKEIKVGMSIVICALNVPNNECSAIIITENILNTLIKAGFVSVVDDEEIGAAIWNKALINLSKKTGLEIENLTNTLCALDKANPWASILFVLKEIAVVLDSKYQNSIHNSKEIYVISPQDGKIHKLDKGMIKNYKAFPAFRSMEDAKIAYGLVEEYLKDIFE